MIPYFPYKLELPIEMCNNYISYCENRLFLFGMSFVAGGGICATVGAMWPGSLAFKETWRVIYSSSCILRWITFEMRTGMYSNPFSTLTCFTSHCLVLLLYLLVTISTPDLLFAFGRLMW